MKTDNIVAELAKLIDETHLESKVQQFLEQYPWLLVSQTLRDDFVISQLPLGADHKCDFAYFISQSNGEFLKLIEIESPTLTIFTENKDDFTAEMNHALQQLDDWSGWCDRNKGYIYSLIEPLVDEDYITGLPGFSRIEFLLIAGRRSQLSNTRRKRRWEERVNRAPRNTIIRTWDGFIESLPLARFGNASATRTVCLRYGEQGYREIRHGA